VYNIHISIYKGEENWMRTFEKWDQLQNVNCRVIINHELFGEQQYDCDNAQIVNDEHRIGVVIKGRELFVYKQEIVDFWIYENAYTVRDEMLTITIVNKM
jgi:hypothetical protein